MASGSKPVPQAVEATHDNLSEETNKLLLQAEQAVAFKQVAQLVMLHVAFCKTLLLLLVALLAVVFVVLVV